MRAQVLVEKLVTIVGVAIAWILLYDLNQYAFSQLEYTSRAHWIFLPAALRIIFVLLFNRLGAIGLIVGAYFTLPQNLDSFDLGNLFLAMSSGIAPLVAVYVARRYISLADDLSGLTGGHIIALSAVCAFVNSVMLSFYAIVMPDRTFTFGKAAAVFVGDMLGAAIVLMVISSSLVLISRLLRSRMYR